MGKYAGDTFLSLDELEASIRAEIKEKWRTASIQDMQALDAKLSEVTRRRGILKRQTSPVGGRRV